MKKLITPAILGIILLASCEKINSPSDETFSVVLESDTVMIDASKGASVHYEIINNADDIRIEHPDTDGITVTNDFEPATGRGTLTFSTCSTCPSEATALIKFYNGDSHIDKEIKVITEPYWEVIPDTPTERNVDWIRE